MCCNDLLENVFINAESELKVSPKFLCEEFETQFIKGLISNENLSNEVSYKLEGIYKTKAKEKKNKKWGKKAKVEKEETQESLPPTINASTVSQSRDVIFTTNHYFSTTKLKWHPKDIEYSLANRSFQPRRLSFITFSETHSNSRNNSLAVVHCWKISKVLENSPSDALACRRKKTLQRNFCGGNYSSAIC